MNRVDRATVTLDSYVNSVAEFIERHDLKNVVLAGHSLGGLTIPGSCGGKFPARIKRVVWVTAMVALDNENYYRCERISACGGDRLRCRSARFRSR